MRVVSLEGKTMDEYLQKIKGYIDELAGVGVLIRHEEHVDAILETFGLCTSSFCD